METLVKSLHPNNSIHVRDGKWRMELITPRATVKVAVVESGVEDHVQDWIEDTVSNLYDEEEKTSSSRFDDLFVCTVDGKGMKTYRHLSDKRCSIRTSHETVTIEKIWLCYFLDILESRNY